MSITSSSATEISDLESRSHRAYKSRCTRQGRRYERLTEYEITDHGTESSVRLMKGAKHLATFWALAGKQSLFGAHLRFPDE